MSKFLPHNYSYANNPIGELIHVTTAQRNEDYFCPICGDLMIPHKGKVRRWHFVHKKAKNCSSESYLHQLAKYKIKQAFLYSEHFLLSYNAKAICSCDCPFIGYPKCDGEKPVEFDLRKFYDSCEIEATYNRFKADLLLSSSTNPKLPPVLIEIMVTHKCTEDKTNNGVRIIEIPIQSEEQIHNIVKDCKLTAVRYNHFKYGCSNKNTITLHNFNKVETFDPVASIKEHREYFNRKNTIVLWLNKQGQFRSFDCHCYEVGRKIPPNVHYFISEIATPFKEIFQEFSKRGVRIRNCFLCKFSKQDIWDNRLCVLYKKHNLPQKPYPYHAVSCPHFREDFDSPQKFILTESTLSKEQIDCYTRHKFYYHICKDIL